MGGFFFAMEKQCIAIQGLRGSFHHEVTHHYFNDEVVLVECETFPEVVKSVINGKADKGVMAIENSLAGCILPNYSLLRHEPIEVVGEVGLRVKLNVMALPGTQHSEIEEVHSHQMALRQCGNFFNAYPHIKMVEVFDTAGGARNIKENNLKNIAAIAGELAASEYGLEVIQKGIEDHELNYTRFLVVQKKGEKQPDDPDRVSIYFQTKNDPGSLAQILTIISGLEINLGKLQSHPVPSKNSSYGFYATLEIDEISQLKDLGSIMQRLTLQFEILGVYKKGETHG